MLAIGENDVLREIDEATAALLRRAGVKRPPVNAIDIATRMGFQVLWDDRQTGRARIAAVRSAAERPPQHAIFLRRDPRPERIQWAVAHEIGEQFAGDLCRRAGIETSESAAGSREQIANALATRLLLPTRWFSRDAAKLDWQVPELKARFATASHELIARRMLDLPMPVLITIFDHGKLSFRRWNQPRRPPPLTPREQQLWQAAHDRGEAASNGEPPRIDVWPIHETGWKREIIRLELQNEEACDEFG